MNYPMAESCGQDLQKANRQPSVREKLEARKRALEEDLEQVNKAIDGLDANPEIAEVIEQISKVGYL